MLCGCNTEEANAETAAAPAEKVNLAATEDLFSAPVMPNPLAMDPAAVVVRVNGSDITRGEVLEIMNMQLQQFSNRIPPEQLEQMKGQMYENVKEQLISRKLVDAAVAASGMTASAEELEAAIAEVSGTLPPGMTIEMALQQFGQTMDQMKEQLKEQIVVRKFMDTKTADVTDATREEVKAFYNENPDKFERPEQVTASHILLGIGEEDNDEAKAAKKAQLEKIRTDIIAGTVTFEAAAKEHSSCPSSAQGGSLGSFGKGQMVPTFEMAAFTQEKDEIGEIIETQFGYHLIKVADRTEAGKVPLVEAERQIKDFLTAQKKQQAIVDYIKSLRDSANIETVEQG